MSKRRNIDQAVQGRLAKAGRLLKKRREELRISHTKAAHISGLSSSTIRRIEAGDSGISLGVLLAYLDSMGAGSLFLEAVNKTLKAARDGDGEVEFDLALAEIKKNMLSERL